MGTKRYFTPKKIIKFAALGRGQGIFEHFIPWHRVSRSDPSSHGRSHLQRWRGRQAELLSDRELIALLFSIMLPHVIDIREQYPLATESAGHELNDYQAGALAGTFPGTLEVAEKLGLRHPVVRELNEVLPWVMTTDLLITLHCPGRQREFLAVSVKPAKGWNNRSAQRNLSIEREYWVSRGVQWLLITEELYDPLVATTLRNSRPWAMGLQFDLPIREWLCERADALHGCTLTEILAIANNRWQNREAVQNALWNAIWSGDLPFDLRRSWRPSAPFILLDEDEFWQRNPIFCRRSAWNH